MLLIYALTLVFMIVGASLWILSRKKKNFLCQSKEDTSLNGKPEKNHEIHWKVPTMPPSAGQGMEALQTRLSDMPTENLRQILEMGATLKSGVEELIEQELEQRL